MTDEKTSFMVVCTYNILFANDIACSTIIEGIEKLKHSPLYRFKTKKYANIVSKERHQYELMVNRVISKGNHSFLANANDIIADEVERHLNILYYSLKREFDRHKLPNAALLARLELARTMVSFSVVNLKKRIKELNSHGINGSLIDYLAMDGILKRMDNLMRTFDIPCVVDMNTPECKTSIDIIGRCLCNTELIAKAIAA